MGWLGLLALWFAVGTAVALGFGAIAARMRGPDDD